MVHKEALVTTLFYNVLNNCKVEKVRDKYFSCQEMTKKNE